MWLTIYYIFCYLVFAYTILLIVGYVWLVFMSRLAQKQLDINLPDDDTIKYLMQGSPLTPAVSIIAPAYNEEVTIIDSVNSIMQIDYPDYEIIIVNDESTDRTMELLIEEYKLVEVPYDIAMRVQSKPIKRVLKSTDERYSKLISDIVSFLVSHYMKVPFETDPRTVFVQTLKILVTGGT